MPACLGQIAVALCGDGATSGSGPDGGERSDSRHPLELLAPRLAEERRQSAQKDEQILALKRVVAQLEHTLAQQNQVAQMEVALTLHKATAWSKQVSEQSEQISQEAAQNSERMGRMARRLEDLETALALAQRQADEAQSQARAPEEALALAEQRLGDEASERAALEVTVLDFKDRCTASEHALREQAMELCFLRHRLRLMEAAEKPASMEAEEKSALEAEDTQVQPTSPAVEDTTSGSPGFADTPEVQLSDTPEVLTPEISRHRPEAFQEESPSLYGDSSSPRLKLAAELSKNISAQSALILSFRCQLEAKDGELACVRQQLADERSLRASERARSQKRAHQRRKMQQQYEEEKLIKGAAGAGPPPRSARVPPSMSAMSSTESLQAAAAMQEHRFAFQHGSPRLAPVLPMQPLLSKVGPPRDACVVETEGRPEVQLMSSPTSPLHTSRRDMALPVARLSSAHATPRRMSSHVQLPEAAGRGPQLGVVRMATWGAPSETSSVLQGTVSRFPSRSPCGSPLGGSPVSGRRLLSDGPGWAAHATVKAGGALDWGPVAVARSTPQAARRQAFV